MIWPFTNSGAKQGSEHQLILDCLEVIEARLAYLTKEVQKMSTNRPTLDQAVNDLDAASTAKLAADAQLDAALAADTTQIGNTTADVAKVESIVSKLNAETAAETAALNPATPMPTQQVTVTGQTAAGTPVVEAPVATGPDAPATQTVPAGTTN